MARASEKVLDIIKKKGQIISPETANSEEKTRGNDVVETRKVGERERKVIEIIEQRKDKYKTHRTFPTVAKPELHFDEEKKLSETETLRDANFWDLTWNSLKRGFYNSAYGEESYNKMSGYKNEADKYGKILSEDDYRFETDTWWEKAISGAAEFVGQFGYTFSRPETWTATLGSAGAGASAAAIAGQLGPQVAAPEEVVTVPGAAITGAIAGYSAESAVAASKIEGGLAYNELREYGVSEETARNIALAVGGVNGLIEAFQVDELLGAYKILNKSGATDSAAKIIFKELARRGVDATKESLQEVAQEGVTMAGVELGSRIDKGEGAFTAKEAGQRLFDTGISSFLTFGAMNVPAATVNSARTIAQNNNKTPIAPRGDLGYNQDSIEGASPVAENTILPVNGEVTPASSSRAKIVPRDSRWKEADYVEAKPGTVAFMVQQGLAEYGIDSFVVNDKKWNTWQEQRKAEGKSTYSAYSHNGQTYMQETLDEASTDSYVVHEGTHVMKETEYKPYIDFVETLPEKINVQSKIAREVLDIVAEHRSMEVTDVSEDKAIAFYDELAASAYGDYHDNSISAKELYEQVFYNYDDFITEMDELHTAFKNERRTVDGQGKTVSAGARATDERIFGRQQREGAQRTSEEGGGTSSDESVPEVRGGERVQSVASVTPAESIAQAYGATGVERSSIYSAYELGRQNTPREVISLEGPAQEEAYNAGRIEYIRNMPNKKTADSKVKAGENNGQQAEASGSDEGNGGTTHGTEKIHIREGGERADGTHTGGEVRFMEEGTGRNQSRETDGSPADSDAASLTLGEEISVASLGIGKGTRHNSIRLVISGDTEATRAAKALAKERGLRLVLFAGDNLTLRGKNGEVISARAYISGDRVFVRADHPDFTADQLMRHEAGHDMIDKGEINLDAVRERIGKEKVEKVSRLYSIAYEGSNMSAEEIFEEIVCDSLGDMNIFSDTLLGRETESFLEETSSAVGETKTEPQQGRAPPVGAKFSRDMNERRRALRKGEMINEFRNKINWRKYYEKLKSSEYNPDHYDDGDIAYMEVDEMVLELKMLRNGEFSVVGITERGYYERSGENNTISDSTDGESWISQERGRDRSVGDKTFGESRGSGRASETIDRAGKKTKGSRKSSAKHNSDGVKSKTSIEVKPENADNEKFSRDLIGKTFPPFNVSRSMANTEATRWAHREDVEAGDQKIIFYKDDAYLVEKYDSSELMYQIEEKIPAQEYQSYKKEINEYGRVRKEQSIAESSAVIDNFNSGRNFNGREKSGINSVQTRHRREDLPVQRVGEKQNEGQQTAGDRNGNLPSSSKNKPSRNITGKTSLGVKPENADNEKFSRETKLERNRFLQNMFSGEVKNNSESSVDFQELAMIRSAVKSGNGRLGKTKRFGSVFAHDNYYLFEFNEDYSITIKNVLDPEIDSRKIEMYEKEFGSGRSKNRKITTIDPWSQLVRSGQGRGIFDNAGSSQQTTSSGSAYVMDDGQSKGINRNGRGRSDDDNFSKGDGDSRGKPSLEIKPTVATPEESSLVSEVQDGVRAAVREELDRMGREYGWIPEGEKAAREVRLPKKTAKDKHVSQTVRTILEAEATPEDILPDIEEMVANGDFSYDRYTDKEAIADAEESIRKRGWEKVYPEWVSESKKGMVSKEHTALGWALYNNAVNSGDTATAIEILNCIVGNQRSAAQALQATRILKKLSPETQLFQVQRSVADLQEEINERYGSKKAPELKISEELAEKFMKAETQEERDAVLKEIYKDIGRHMPSNWMDKWRAWRYFAMLCNPPTHLRNILGNALFTPIVAVKNLTETAIEAAVFAVSGGKIERTKGISRDFLKLLSAAWKDYGRVSDAISGDGKYTDGIIASKDIEDGRVIFKSKVMAPVEKLRKFNSKALDREDMWFSKPHYAFALAQYAAANGITAEQIKNGDVPDKAYAYAIKEARKATFRDLNACSYIVSRRFSETGNFVGAQKFLNRVVDGVLPFRKTPANILARGIEYSPIGLANGIKQALWDVRKGDKTAAEAIDSISAGLTGTGLMALGMLLCAQGIIRGHGSDDEKEREFEELMGHQAYALELPGGVSVTLDWLAPEALPFFVGANIWEVIQENRENGEKFSFVDALAITMRISEPMFEMSCLQSLTDLFEAGAYAVNNDTDGLSIALTTALTSYLLQGVPTLGGRFERIGEDIRYTTYTDKEGFLPQGVQGTLGKAAAKIPGIDLYQIPYIDAWGRTEKTGGVGTRVFNNLLNPAYTSTVEESDMEKELLRLYDATGEGGVFPKYAAKTITVDGKKKYLTAEEYVKYAEKKGKTSRRVVEALVKNSAYKEASDKEKAKMVQLAYDYSNELAKSEVSDYTPDKWALNCRKAKRAGVSEEVFIALKVLTADIESLKDKKGETITNSASLLKMKCVYSVRGLSDEQRQILFESFGVGKTVRKYNKALVESKLKRMKKGYK